MLALLVMLAAMPAMARAQDDDQDALTVHDLMTHTAPTRRLLVEDELKPVASDEEFFTWDDAYGAYGHPCSPWAHSSDGIGAYGGM
jgi:CubicO group peptidase (beta-lactamase class C family)